MHGGKSSFHYVLKLLKGIRKFLAASHYGEYSAHSIKHLPKKRRAKALLLFNVCIEFFSFSFFPCHYPCFGCLNRKNVRKQQKTFHLKIRSGCCRLMFFWLLYYVRLQCPGHYLLPCGALPNGRCRLICFGYCGR